MNFSFLLRSDKARELYNYIKDLPIVDYHNHLSVEDIKTNKRFLNIYELWIKPDPYKHRAMRMMGVSEKYITGDAPDIEKFKKWCSVFPKLIGNPLYLWSIAELRKIFNETLVPNEKNAEALYIRLNDFLKENELTPKKLFEIFNIDFICPCVSLTDDFSFFENQEKIKPSLRGDDLISPTGETIKKLSAKTGIEIKNLNDYKKAIVKELNEFKRIGGKFTDHSLDSGFCYCPDDLKSEERFINILEGEIADKEKLLSYLLKFLAGEYARLGFVMQLHMGAKRETSSRLKKLAGGQGGFAAIGNSIDISSLTAFLDEVEGLEYGLPKTLIFNLNPSDNEKTAVLSGSYSKDGVKGLITQGPAWWWCDHISGIKNALESTFSYGQICNFVGMTTDSRCFLSLIRHDYFRRILCNFFAEKIENGEILSSDEEISEILCDICFNNAKGEITNGI